MALVLVFVLQFNDSKTLPLTTTFLDTSLSMKTDARLHVRLLIRNIVNRPKVWNHIAKQADLRLVESIRKRKKRQREVIYIPPSNRRVVRLQSETGFFLEILPSGKVGGSVNKTEFSEFYLLSKFLDCQFPKMVFGLQNAEAKENVFVFGFV